MASQIRVDIYSLEIAKPAAAATESSIRVTEYFILYPITFCSSEYFDIQVLITNPFWHHVLIDNEVLVLKLNHVYNF